MNKHLFFVIAIASLLVTCKGEDYSKELATIDSLKGVLVVTDSLIQSANVDDIQKKSDEIANNSKFIQFNVNKLQDTLDFNTALILTDYRALGKEFKMMATNITKLESAMDSASVSLNNLTHDLNNHSLADGVNAQASVQAESEQIGEMHAFMEDLLRRKQDARQSYDTLLPKVNTIVQQMSAKLDAKQNK